MIGSSFTNINPGTLYSFFPPNKPLRISKQNLNFINNKHSSNISKNKFNNDISYDNFNIKDLNFIVQNQAIPKKQNSNKIFEITSNKWTHNNDQNQPKQKYTSLASSTGKNFYRNPNKIIQSSYGRKYYLINGYDMNKNNKKKNNAIKNKGLRVSSVEKNSLNNRIIERFINLYKTNDKKVLYEMGLIKNISNRGKKEVLNSNFNFNNIKSANIKDSKKLLQQEKNYNDLPFLRNQIQDKNKNTLKKKKNFSQPSSETNIININNFINFFSDINNITYNNNYNSNNNLQQYVNNNININNNNNNLYSSATDVIINNNNLACNSTNSNIGNNNIIFGNLHQFGINSKNIKIKSRAMNSLSSAHITNSTKKIISGESSTGIVSNNLLSPDKNPKNETNTNLISNNYNIGINPKKSRAISTSLRHGKLNSKKEYITSKDTTKIKNSNNNNNNNNNNINSNLNNIKDNKNSHNINKISNSNVSSSIYASIISNNSDKLSKYDIGKILGKGAYANVKLVTNIITKENFAMKIYEKEKLSDNSKKKCVYREIEILKRVNHENITKLIEVINTQKQILIIQELVEGISLRDYYNREIRNQKGISEHKSMIFKKIFKQIFSAMNYLHNHYIAHRDIKLENILMTKEYTIKIIDFGFGMYNPENKLQSFFCGTPNYMAPEIAFKKPYVGQKADCWSLGVLVYKMFCADFPFKGKNEKDLYKNIKKGKFTMANYSPQYIKNIIVNMIELDPNKRLSCQDVLNSDWLKD